MSFSKWTHPTNEFVYYKFNIYHKDCLTYSDATDRPRELCDDFSLWNDLTQIVNVPTQIPNCDLHSATLLDLFISSEPCICPSVAFPPFKNSDSVVVSVSIGFTSTTNGDVFFHNTALLFSYWLGMSLYSVERYSMERSLILNIRSILIYFPGFQLLVLRP